MSAPDDRKNEIGRIAAVIATARGHLASGRTVDLTALQTRVRLLCDSIETAPPANPEDISEALGALLSDLDDLEKDLIARQDAHTDPSHDSDHLRAADAYRRREDET